MAAEEHYNSTALLKFYELTKKVGIANVARFVT